MDITKIDGDSKKSADASLIELIQAQAEPLDVHRPDLDALVDRIGSSRVVLLGESTHGTEEFYDLRAALTMKLVREKGFNVVCLEADWPDMEGVNEYIHSRREEWGGFARFPEWMWRNHSFEALTRQLRAHNSSERNLPVNVYGLDLYSLSASLDNVYQFLQKQDPASADIARRAKACLHPWQFDPSQYGLAVLRGHIEGCREQIFDLLRNMHETQMTNSASNKRLLSALQNAKIVANAESYYRTMYESSVDSWNLRDQHMFETLLLLMDHYGPLSKVIVWEHNSHLGNAAATQMGRIGELNIGQLCKSKFGDACYNVGFMTDNGTVAAASEWDGPMEVKRLLPTRTDSFENLLHRAHGDYLLPLRHAPEQLREALRMTRLERAVGVLYLPQSERQSHYFHASLSDQFDEICWIDETHAVKPLAHIPERGEADMKPTGL